MYDVALVELALVVVDHIGAGGHVGRYEDVGPVVSPSGIVLIVVGRRCYSLHPLRILFARLSHFASPPPILSSFNRYRSNAQIRKEDRNAPLVARSMHPLFIGYHEQ